MEQSRLTAETAARKFISKHFPDCQGAILAGSVVRGEATTASDLDIIVFDSRLSGAYRESFIEFDWPIEVFVHTFHSYKKYFQQDIDRARPSLPRMVFEGIVLKDTEKQIPGIKKEAEELLSAGPKSWTTRMIAQKRYFLTDVLDDFIGSHHRAEDLLIASTLAQLTSEFYLRVNRQWIGASKWILRALRQYDIDFAERFTLAFDSFYRTGDKEEIIQIVDSVLDPYGGRLFAGFSLGKDDSLQKEVRK
ncbi:nucleotidyltransferase domain-containing protein [Virgibacillus senegalensis]|uniref:nucleotidyltransferase domain-containing protein n=1 Tax=Virgibacillus senegalensis TaxID=1499679 RepID=UPI000B0BC17E|nr:nucleotidyltransferase domain-containing protein [Virgibacillus senegalensis]